MPLATVHVCTHALERWRERASRYADATEDDLIAALRQSRIVGEDDFLPMARTPGFHYYRHEESGCYLIVQPIDMESSRVVTVIVPGQAGNPLLPKKKQKKVRPVAVVSFAAPPAPVVVEDDLPEPEWVEPSGPVEEVYPAIRARLEEIDRELSGMKLKRLRKTDPARLRLLIERQRLTTRMAELKDAYRDRLSDRAREENKKLVRDDGSLSFEAALRLLLEKVGRIEEELGRIRAELAKHKENTNG